MENVMQEFINGFNDGYLLAQNLPELSDQLAHIPEQSEYIEGLKKGMDERSLEIENLPRPEWLNHSRSKFLDQDKSFEVNKDKDDLERE